MSSPAVRSVYVNTTVWPGWMAGETGITNCSGGCSVQTTGTLSAAVEVLREISVESTVTVEAGFQPVVVALYALDPAWPGSSPPSAWSNTQIRSDRPPLLTVALTSLGGASPMEKRTCDPTVQVRPLSGPDSACSHHGSHRRSGTGSPPTSSSTLPETRALRAARAQAGRPGRGAAR